MINENEVTKYVQFYSTSLGKGILEQETRFVNERLMNRKKILSIGCGPALLEEKIHQLHPDMNIIGLDISKEMIQQAPKSIPVLHGYAQHLEFATNSFDAVVFVTSLEFIEDHQKAIKETYKVLESKGKILVLMLNPRSEYFKKKYADKNSYIRKNIKHKNVREMKRVVSKYFSVENEGYFLGIKKQKLVATANPLIASLYTLEGKKL